MRRFVLSIVVIATSVAAGGAAEPVVRVMSYNIRYATAPDGENHWEKRKDLLAETVKAFDPDLLGTQETLASQRDYLAEKLKGHTAFAAGRDDGKEKGEMAALYFRSDRFEKLDGGHFWLSETPEKVGSKGWDAALPRVATWVKLKDKQAPAAVPVFYLNTHFDHRGVKARLESAKLDPSETWASSGPGCRLIVTGDFNAGEGSEPYKALFDKAGETGLPCRGRVPRWSTRRAAKRRGRFPGSRPRPPAARGSTGSGSGRNGPSRARRSTGRRRMGGRRRITSRSRPCCDRRSESELSL